MERRPQISLFETIIGAGIGALGTVTGAWLRTRGKGKPSGRNGKSWRRFVLPGLVGILLGAVLGFWVGEIRRNVLEAPFDIQGHYHPSGFMGDRKGLEMFEGYRQVPSPGDSDSACIQFKYKPVSQPESKGWAGVYWQRPDGNWGEVPGSEIVGASKLTFYARGERGGELVRFKVGGIRNFADKERTHSDSLEANHPQVSLTPDWKRYEINLEGHDLSEVIGAFAWTASANANPGGVVIYIDQIRFE